MNDEPIYIGRRAGQPEGSNFWFGAEDARHHTYIIGKTGSGKTTLLRNLILQHLSHGSGLALLDPHGDLAEDILDHFPPSRADHLVYFNPSDLEHPIGLNPLADVPPDDRHLVASGITASFKSIWRDSWGPRMEYILYNSLAALLDCRGSTLLGVNRLLTDPQFREHVTRQVTDPFIRAFWREEFAGYDSRFVREAIAPIQNKLGQFLMNPPIRNILGQVRTKVDFRFTIDTGRIFIANLSKGKLGADKANLLGSLLTTQFQLAAMGRAGTPERNRRDFHLFIDEFHNFTTDSFASILAEARKYRLCLVLAHQYVDQLTEPVRKAVFGNVGTMVAFRIGHTDADVLSKEYGEEYPASRFADQNRFEAVVSLLQDGRQCTPFRAYTLPPIEGCRGRRENLIRHCRTRFATPRAVVEDKLERWMGAGR